MNNVYKGIITVIISKLRFNGIDTNNEVAVRSAINNIINSPDNLNELFIKLSPTFRSIEELKNFLISNDTIRGILELSKNI